MNRRQFLQKSLTYPAITLAASAGILSPISVMAAWPKASFEKKTLTMAIKDLYGDITIKDSDKVNISGPSVAENGATVPLKVKSTLANVESVAIFVEKNIFPLSSQIIIHNKFNGKLSLRVKMAESSKVICLVKSDGQYYQSSLNIKVTLGGCGG